MAKKYEINEKRYEVVKKDEIRLFEDGSNKWMAFTHSRWAHFAGQFAEIYECVPKVAAGQQDVKLQLILEAADTSA